MVDSHERERVLQLAAQLGKLLDAKGWKVAVAESCTGGGVAAAITAIAGSSSWFEYGVVTYANAAKQHLLGVEPDTLATQGAVSEPVVGQMVDGVLSLSRADIAVSTSGIAGPSGGSPDKPVGTVWFAWGLASGEKKTMCYHLNGERQEIQRQAVIIAIKGLLALLEPYSQNPE